MSTWDGGNYYYSGQGVLLIGKRTSLGKPQGLIPVGNVSNLKIAIAQSNLEHKESQSGQRLIDLRLTTETNGSVAAVLESINSVNLKLSLRADRTDKLAGTVSTENIAGYLGAVSPLKYAKVTITNVKRAAQALTAWVNDQTTWDYKVNTDAGSLLFNDGSVIGVDKLTTGGADPTAFAVGNPTTVTVAVPSYVAVGDKFMLTGAAGADAALVNSKAFEILSLIGPVGAATGITINVDTTGKTITVAGAELTFFDGQPLTCDYTFAGQKIIDALTQPSNASERWLRFEGLNTADGNNPVVIDIFRVQLDAAKELDLISDALQSLTLEGSLLYDSLQATGSKWFKETLLR